MELRPLYNRIVVKRWKEETESDGGIIILDKVGEKPLKGDVLAVGPGRILDNGDLVKIQVAVGDVVVFGKLAGEEIELDNEKYIVMHADEVLAIVEDDE